MKYLLDTNVISESVAKLPDARVAVWLRSMDPNICNLSAVTIGEIAKGILKLPVSWRRDQLQHWLDHEVLDEFRDNILVVDVETMIEWGELTSRLEKRGRNLPFMDSILAAQAIHFHCTLVTRNERDFEGCGIEIYNPWRA